jgi:predicted tellurium resistance membrane protein TerC
LVTDIRTFVQRHPMVVAWVILAVGMIALLLYAAKDVPLLPTQLAALVVATVLLAGACVWILTWD